MMRKELIISVVAAILTIGISGEPVNSMLGASGVENGDEPVAPVTASDYVQNNLVAMWDGIENADWGIHDSNATVWKDLSGNGYDLVLTSRAAFGADAFEVINGGGVCAEANYALPYNDNSYHYEIVCSYDGILQNTALLVFCGGGYGSGLSGTIAYSTVVLYAWAKYARKSFCCGNPSTVFTTGGDYTFTGIHQGSSTYNFSAYDGVVLTTVSASGDISRLKHSHAKISFGDNVSNNLPTGFRIHSLRIYGSRLSGEERLYNYFIDKTRFGVP